MSRSSNAFTDHQWNYGMSNSSSAIASGGEYPSPPSMIIPAEKLPPHGSVCLSVSQVDSGYLSEEFASGSSWMSGSDCTIGGGNDTATGGGFSANHEVMGGRSDATVDVGSVQQLERVFDSITLEQRERSTSLYDSADDTLRQMLRLAYTVDEDGDL